MKNELFRQGDVLLQRVGKGTIKGKSKKIPRDRGRIILAYGEVTGHAHAVVDASAELIELENGDRFLCSDAGIRIVHEEHSTVTLPAGTYQVTRQREYSPEEIRNVAD